MTDADRCERCGWQRRVCLCDAIPVVPTRTHVVIVRHHLERSRSSNSGRLAHLALPNSELVDYGAVRGATTTLPPLDGAVLLFPEGAPVTSITTPPKQLVVLDASWSQARRMYRKLDALRGVPLLRLPTGALPARMREAPSPDRVSTIEAIARALRLIEGEEAAGPLEELFAVAVRRAAMTGREISGSSGS